MPMLQVSHSSNSHQEFVKSIGMSLGLVQTCLLCIPLWKEPFQLAGYLEEKAVGKAAKLRLLLGSLVRTSNMPWDRVPLRSLEHWNNLALVRVSARAS